MTPYAVRNWGGQGNIKTHRLLSCGLAAQLGGWRLAQILVREQQHRALHLLQEAGVVLGQRRELLLRKREGRLDVAAADELDELLLLQLKAQLRVALQDRAIERVDPLDGLLHIATLDGVPDGHAIGHSLEVDAGCRWPS